MPTPPRLPLIGEDNNTWGSILNEYLDVSLTTGGVLRPIAGTIVTADPFQTPTCVTSWVLDASLHKDFICVVDKDTTISLSGTSNGDAGQIEVLMSGAHTVTLTLLSGFTKDLGGTALVTTDLADNFIGWRKVGAYIVYNIVQVQTP